MRLEEINLRGPVRVGFYDPFEAFPAIQQEFLSKFPLSNLHWRYDPLKPVKSIPLLPVELVEEFPSLQSKRISAIAEHKNNVYARLMFVKAADIDTYRSQVRPLVHEWLKTLVKPYGVMWCIVLVVPTGKKDKNSTIIKMSVYDKLKLDFEVGGKQVAHLDLPVEENPREHVLRIYQEFLDDITKLQTYNDVVSTMKVLILQTFNLRFVRGAGEVERLKLTAHHAGDRLELFREKLNLAGTLNDMRCLDESLELYEELLHDFSTLGLGLPAGTSRPEMLKGVDYGNFDPEDSKHEIDPYTQFCLAVEQRRPIDAFEVNYGLFVKISILLQTLANFANLISISSAHISNLLQKLIAFLNQYARLYADSAEMDQWLYAMAEFYLNLPLAHRLVELDAAQNENNDTFSSVAGILEYFAELRLFKRLALLKLAKKKHFDSPTDCLLLEDVPLEDKTQKEKPEFALSFPGLAESLESQHSYEDRFEQLTIDSIQDYAKCDRIKTIDILSIDLAILHHKRKEYKQALEILQNSYDYFIRDGWSYVGGVLLEIFLSCVEHVEPESNEQFLSSTLRLFASMKSGDGATYGINDYNVVKHTDERLRLFEKIRAISEKIDTPQIYPLEEFFEVKIQPFAEIQDDDGRFLIRATISNRFGLEVPVMRATVSFVDADETANHQVDFTAHDIVSEANEHTEIQLFTNVFCAESLKVDRVSVQIAGKLIFSAVIEHEPEDFADETVIHNAAPKPPVEPLSHDALLNTRIKMFPSLNHFRIEMVKPATEKLGSSHLDCVLHNGPKKVTNVSMSLSRSTHGLQIAKDLDDFTFDDIDAYESQRVPFDCNNEKNVEIDIVCHYEIEGEKFEYHTKESFDLNLKVSISVQDIFRTSSIYSKFQIGCVDSQFPIRLNKSDFSCRHGKYDVTTLSSGTRELAMIVQAEQPAYLFYKIVPTTGQYDPDDILDFSVHYSDLQKECEDIAGLVLLKELEKCGKQNFFLLLAPILSQLQFDLLKYTVEQVVSAENVAVCSKIMNDKLAKYVSHTKGKDLVDILSRIFNGESLILPDDIDLPVDLTELVIPVSLPHINVLHHVEIILEKDAKLVVGLPIDTRIIVKSTSKWSEKAPDMALASSSPQQKSQPPPKTFELAIPTEDDWLISGLQRQNFLVGNEEETTEMRVSLIPLNAGELVLPRVAIKVVQDERCTMDVIRENALETVLVVPELDSVTFTF